MMAWIVPGSVEGVDAAVMTEDIQS